MKYWKNLQMMGTVKESATKPTNGYWIEISEQEYIKRKMAIDFALANLGKAVAVKKRLLRAE